jgi:hypothetical protein
LYNFTNTWGRPSDEEWEKLQLDDDYWRPSVPDYYRFALSRPQLDGLLMSPHNEAELADTLRALEEGPLSPEEEEHIVNLTEMVQGSTRLKDRAESEA